MEINMKPMMEDIYTLLNHYIKLYVRNIVDETSEGMDNFKKLKELPYIQKLTKMNENMRLELDGLKKKNDNINSYSCDIDKETERNTQPIYDEDFIKRQQENFEKKMSEYMVKYGEMENKYKTEYNVLLEKLGKFNHLQDEHAITVEELKTANMTLMEEIEITKKKLEDERQQREEQNRIRLEIKERELIHEEEEEEEEEPEQPDEEEIETGEQEQEQPEEGGDEEDEEDEEDEDEEEEHEQPDEEEIETGEQEQGQPEEGVDEEDEEDEEDEDEDEEEQPEEEEIEADGDGDGDGDEESEDEAEVFEIEIKGTKYYVEDEDNGPVYECLEFGDIGETIGQLVNGKLEKH